MVYIMRAFEKACSAYSYKKEFLLQKTRTFHLRSKLTKEIERKWCINWTFMDVHDLKALHWRKFEFLIKSKIFHDLLTK